ncbi:MAG TPA: OsmC family protein [Ramlibacter sp.]|nr:OsmC family protein [Ramlibacter sp.]
MPAIHTATVEWHLDQGPFTDRRYGRAHDWRFDGGAVVRGSSSPHVVRAPYSDPAAVDPEEAYVAAIASCHMLWFLDLACRDGWVVRRYLDAAEGRMAAREDGREWVAEVVLHPQVTFGDREPTREQLRELHHRAHVECFIANSIRTEVRVAAG